MDPITKRGIFLTWEILEDLGRGPGKERTSGHALGL